MDRYMRAPLEVDAAKYEIGMNMEDGYELFSKVITNGGVVTEGLVQITRIDGTIVCPYIRNRRGLVFIREGDYIIVEGDGEKHACGADKFFDRFHIL